VQLQVWPGPSACNISQLIKTNGHHTVLVGILTLVHLASLRFPWMLPLLPFGWCDIWEVFAEMLAWVNQL
jgi:hypothetical protein